MRPSTIGSYAFPLDALPNILGMLVSIYDAASIALP